jgi:hypothetical protein
MQPPQQRNTSRSMRVDFVCSPAWCRASTKLEWLTRTATLRTQLVRVLWCAATKVAASLEIRKIM